MQSNLAVKFEPAVDINQVSTPSLLEASVWALDALLGMQKSGRWQDGAGDTAIRDLRKAIAKARRNE